MNPNDLPAFIAESPFHVLLTGFLAVFVLTITWIIQKHWLFLGMAIFAAAVTTLLVVLESALVTDREQIDIELDQMAECVRKNDAPGLVEHLSESSPGIRALASSQMSQWEIDFCRITSRSVPKIERDKSPPIATLDFAAFARGMRKTGDGLGGADVVRASLWMQKDPDGRWRVIKYSIANQAGGVSYGN